MRDERSNGHQGNAVSGGDPAQVGRPGVLKGIALGAATILVLGDGLVAYRAYDQGVLAGGRGPAFRALEDWQTYDGHGLSA